MRIHWSKFCVPAIIVLTVSALVTLPSCGGTLDKIKDKTGNIGASSESASKPEADAAAREKAEKLFAKGEEYLNEGKLWKAVDEWEKVVDKNPDHPGAHFRLGFAYKKIGDRARTAGDFETAAEAYKRALYHYRKAVEITPGDPRLHNNIANVYYVLGDYDAAIPEYTQAISIKPDAPAYHYNVANTYSKNGMYELAMVHYSEAIRLDPDLFDAYYNLAVLYEKVGDIKNAVKYYKEYIGRENRESETEWVRTAKEKNRKLTGDIVN